MNKKFILLASLIFLVGLVIFVSGKMTSTNGYSQDVELSISQGWNLILSPIWDDKMDISPDSEIKMNDIKYIYYYLRYDNKYILMYPYNNNLWMNSYNVLLSIHIRYKMSDLLKKVHGKSKKLQLLFYMICKYIN